MNRLRNFDFPHKTLRSLLSRFTLLAGTIDYSNEKELAALRLLGEDMFFLLENHLHHENTHTFQLIEKHRPGGAKFEYDDHERVEQIQHDLKRQLNVTITDGHDFYLAACKFQSEYLNHIHHEETITEALLWELFTDEELINHRTEIMKNIDPNVLLKWLKYGIPACSLEGSIGMLKGFKAGAPPEIFETAMNTIQPEMDPSRFATLRNELD